MTRAQAATYIVGVIMSVDATTLGLNNQPNPSNPGGVSDLQLFQNQQSAAYNRTLVSGNFANQSANASNLNYPVAGPATNAGYIGAQTSETGVTFISSTVVTAQGQISVAAAANNPALITGQAVPTDNITMTTNIETIPAFGTLAINQTVSGISAAAGGTFQTGDVINGGGVVGNNVINITGNGQATAGGELVTINNVTRVNTSLAQNTSLQAASWTGVGQSWVSNVTAAGNTATLINGALATTYGAYNTALATTYNVGLRAADVTGASNTLQLAASGAGATGNTFTINSTTATGVEGISFAGSGTNDVTLTGVVGAATDLVSLAITGSGVNTISTQGLTQLATVSAGTSTGTNVVNVGTSLVNNFTYTGGTGADTLRATTSGQVRTGITLSGVETLRLDSGAAASTLVFSAAPNLSTVRLDTGAAGANAILKSLVTVGSFATLDYRGTSTTAAAANTMVFNDLTVSGGFAGAADTLAVTFGNGGVTLTNATPYTVGTLNAGGLEIANYTIADTLANGLTGYEGITSSTLSTVNFTGTGSVTQAAGNITTGVANSNTIAVVNYSGLTGTVVSDVTIGSNIGNEFAGAVVVRAGAGGLTANINSVEVNTDVLTFVGGAGNDTLNANGAGASQAYAGIINATLGTGTNAVNLAGTANGSVVTVDGAGSANTISIAAAGLAAGATLTVAVTGAGATTTVNGNNAADSIAFNATVAGTNTVNTAAGNDTINASGTSVAVTLVGGAGADLITLGTGVDTLGTGNNFGAVGQSIIASANTTANPIAAGNTITFATGFAGAVDRVVGFTSGTDKLDVVTASTAPTTLIGVGNAAALANGTTYVLYGSYNTGTGVFTSAAAYGVGATDALVVVGDGALTAVNTTGYAVLQGLNQALVAADFV